MTQKIQKFGSSLITPILLFTFAGLVISITTILNNPNIVGSIANEGTVWRSVISIIDSAGWTVFNHIELLFVIGIPIGLVSVEKGRAALTTFVLYLTYNNFVAGILEHFGSQLGFDYSAGAGFGTGLRNIAGITTLDTSIVGAIFIAAIGVWIHNRFYTKKLPDLLGVFQGSTLVYIVGFFVMMPVAILTVLVWPLIQNGISSMQGFIANAGLVGVWLYHFLERILIPTGLHHFVWQPFILGPAVIEGGIQANWFASLNDLANSTGTLGELFPVGVYSLTGMSKIFGSIGIALAIYSTAKPEKQKKVLAILLPVTFTAVMTGVTEPLEFTFLFVAPALFVVHSLLAATMSTITAAFGVSGLFGSGIIEFTMSNWIPLWQNHWGTYITQIIIGVVFIGIYFLAFRILILKFDFATPGREADDKEVKLFSKKEYSAKQKTGDLSSDDALAVKAATILDLLGGASNILEVTNCISRLRLTLKDDKLVASPAEFTAAGAHGLVKNGKAVQVIIGTSVTQFRVKFDELL